MVDFWGWINKIWPFCHFTMADVSALSLGLNTKYISSNNNIKYTDIQE